MAWRQRLSWLPLLALFLTVLGARLWLINEYGNALPYWDQWDGEAGETLKPWLDGRLQFTDLFQPHAEHRIFCTRVMALGLVAVNGQWDAFLEMVVDAGICAFIAVGLAAVLRRALAPRLQNTVLLAVAGLFCLPFAWENTLAGFQSQFYFLLGNSLLALWGLGTRPAFSRGWWAGAAGAVLACFSMGSGVLAAAAVLGWSGLRALKTRRWPEGGEMATWLACLAVMVMAWQSRVNVPQHADLRAVSAGAWLLSLGRCLAWPRILEPAWALVMILPLGLLFVFWLRRPAANGNENALLLSGLWVVLQAAAMAFARGGQGLPPQSRYMDLLGLGAMLNLLAAGVLVGRQPPGTQRRDLTLGAATLWTGVLLSGLAPLTQRNLETELPGKRDRMRVEETNTRAYVLTGDRSALAAQPLTDSFVPYPNLDYLITLLDDPAVRGILPVDVRPRVRVAAGGKENAGFVENGLPPALAATVGPGSPRVLGSFVPAQGGSAAQGKLDAVLQPSPKLPYLQFQVAGGLGSPGLALGLRDARTGRTSELRPAKVPGERWRTEYLSVPGGDLHLVTEDSSAGGWLALREPAEVGRLSYWAGFLARRGGGLGLAGGAALLSWVLWRWLAGWLPAQRV